MLEGDSGKPARVWGAMAMRASPELAPSPELGPAVPCAWTALGLQQKGKCRSILKRASLQCSLRSSVLDGGGWTDPHSADPARGQGRHAVP